MMDNVAVAENDRGDGGMDAEVDMEVEMQMDLKEKKRDFHHPFTPYSIQEEFMETVWGVLEGGGGRVGILESPTGTVGLLLFNCVDFWFRIWVLGFGFCEGEEKGGGDGDVCVWLQGLVSEGGFWSLKTGHAGTLQGVDFDGNGVMLMLMLWLVGEIS